MVACRLAHNTTTTRLLTASIGVGLAGLPILLAATNGQILGPLAVAGIAQAAGLRIGLVILPALALG